MDTQKKVLLVEKDNAIWHFVRSILKNELYDLDFADDAKYALTKIQNNTTDLILFDCTSLGVNMSEFISLIKNSTDNMPSIIALTKNISDDVDYTQHPVDDLITKPLNSTELQYRINRVFDRRNMIDLLNKDRADSEALLQISEAVSSTLSSKEILHIIVKNVAFLFDATRCSIFRVAQEEKFAQVIASHDNPDIELEITIDNYPEVKKALETREMVIVQYILLDPLMKEVQENIQSLKNNAIVVIPIILKDNVIGTLFLRSVRDNKFFNEREIKFLKVVARIAANALDNAFLYENLESTRLQLIQSERLRALGELATGVAHNFNNLLSGILGHTQMLLSKNLDPATCERLQIIEKLVLDGSEVVRRIQEFTRLRTTKDFSEVNIKDIINDVVRMTESKWSGGSNIPKITLRIDTDSMEIPIVEGNASELREVFINILFNAVDAMPKGGEFTIQTKTNGKDIFVYFIDTGEGMSAETKKRVFDPFFTTKGSKGTGLGMSVAYGIISRHSGHISIDSELGVGTTVIVQLPISEKFIKEMERKYNLKHEEKTKILLIEDHKITLDVLAENLINLGHHVQKADSGMAGIKMFKDGNYDIVITDVGLCDISGWAVSKKIKDMSPLVPIVFITGWANQLSPSQLKECDVDFILAKPFKIEEISSIIKKAIDSRKVYKLDKERG
ncbi:MAG TPA: response regulator [Candidatus Wunengus sp. YC60]|uniref:response regulator n=1 Tax=Candidatus Wunengus sp. YC60 TaxID=3367697 RepID=UPI004028C203